MLINCYDCAPSSVLHGFVAEQIKQQFELSIKSYLEVLNCATREYASALLTKQQAGDLARQQTKGLKKNFGSPCTKVDCTGDVGFTVTLGCHHVRALLAILKTKFCLCPGRCSSPNTCCDMSKPTEAKVTLLDDATTRKDVRG